MIKPIRLQLSRKRGFDLQEISRAANGLEAVNVARPGPWGNPFRIGESCDKAQIRRWGWKFAHPEFVCEDTGTAVRRFRGCLLKDEAIHDHVRSSLRGRNLACWCAPGAPCHADVLLELANAEPGRKSR